MFQLYTRKSIYSIQLFYYRKKDIFSHPVLALKMYGRHFWVVRTCKRFWAFLTVRVRSSNFDRPSSVVRDFYCPISVVQLWPFYFGRPRFWPSKFGRPRFWPSSFDCSVLTVQFYRPVLIVRDFTVQFWPLEHHPSAHFEILAAAMFLLQHSGTNYSTCSRPFLWQKTIQIQLERFGTKLTISQNAMSGRNIS